MHSHCVAINSNVGSVSKRGVIVHPFMYSGCADVYIRLNKQANGMLGFGDDSDVLTSYARLTIMIMIVMYNVSYASHLAGVRWRVVRINEYQRGWQDTCFFLGKRWTFKVHTVYDIHLFYLT